MTGTLTKEKAGCQLQSVEKVTAFLLTEKVTAFLLTAFLLYPIYGDLGMTLWETVSPPPQGDNDLAAAKAGIGDRICLLGNLDQIRFLKTATPEEVDAATRGIVRIGKPGGRYLFAASDFLEKNTPVENVIAMLTAASDEGGY
jgi:uroporphyrinogen-III decarboxylase